MLYKFEFRTYQRKFKRPLQTSHGIWDIRSGIILRLVGENSQIGWGEIAPLSWFGSESFEQALDFCHQFPGNISSEMIFAISAELPACQFGFESALSNEKSSPPPAPPCQGGEKAQLPACQFGFESALSNEKNSPPPAPPCQGGEKSENLTYLSQKGEKMQNRFSGLLPAGETALQALQVLWLEGYRTFKWKIGVAAIEQELKIFQQLIEAMHNLCDRESAFLRLDANGGLSYSQAKTWLEACDKVKATPDFSADIEFLEQPLPVTQFQEMVELNAIYATAIALDESAANLDRIQECYSQGWRGIFVIKPAIAGSPSQLRKFCQTHNIDAVFSSVFETEIGRQAALNLATQLSLNKRALGFGTDCWFDDNHSILDFRF
ncbi:o-succinylbenzoate synthase [Microcoleus asticus]|uniref:o-succinylbenzoate synthase n=1 Tax=Microcoleus asticus IPMA8 TaxID=2563858 RepID=A0ABX2CXV8_9CYAN|nr:o-succinylbenzoate synthase [Microcoleus asticus]NQE35246.1 o-succinylbenzoate synthase [Microcoleus asticus IPMA8]